MTKTKKTEYDFSSEKMLSVFEKYEAAKKTKCD